MNMVLNHKGHDGQDTERKQILCLSVLMKDSTFTNAHEVDDEDEEPDPCAYRMHDVHHDKGATTT